MPLSPEFLQYTHRRHGMDHDRYVWGNLFERPRISWPNGANVAVLITVPLEFFPLDQQGKPFKAPGGMMTTYPDFRHYSSRDYGNRVGIFRLFKVLDELGLKATIPVNSVLAERYPRLIEEINKRGHEIMAHGVDMDTLHYGGLDPEQEREQVQASVETLRRLTGQPIQGWLSPAFSESFATPDLLTEAGIRYVGDWANDDLPYRMNTANGPLIAIPISQELNDRQIIFNYHHTEDVFVQQIQDQFDTLQTEAGQYGGRVLSLTLHPYISGLPYRIWAVKQALSYVAGQSGVWSATGSEILEHLTTTQYL